MYADFEYYVNTYGGGKITSEAEYNRLATMASAFILQEMMTPDIPDAMTDRVKMCECAVCDWLVDEETAGYIAGITSANNDGLSVSYGNVKAERKAAFRDILGRWLLYPYNLISGWI